MDKSDTIHFDYMISLTSDWIICSPYILQLFCWLVSKEKIVFARASVEGKKCQHDSAGAIMQMLTDAAVFGSHWFLRSDKILNFSYFWIILFLRYDQIFTSSYFYRTRVRSLFTLVTNSLTDSRLVKCFDLTLAFEDDDSKLVEDVTVADVDDEDLEAEVWS